MGRERGSRWDQMAWRELRREGFALDDIDKEGADSGWEALDGRSSVGIVTLRGFWVSFNGSLYVSMMQSTTHAHWSNYKALPKINSLLFLIITCNCFRLIINWYPNAFCLDFVFWTEALCGQDGASHLVSLSPRAFLQMYFDRICDFDWFVALFDTLQVDRKPLYKISTIIHKASVTIVSPLDRSLTAKIDSTLRLANLVVKKLPDDSLECKMPPLTQDKKQVLVCSNTCWHDNTIG